MELIEYGAGPLVALALYTIIDKVVVPQLTKKDSNGPSSIRDLERRIESNSRQCDQLREAVAETRTAIAVAREILIRIEEQIK